MHARTLSSRLVTQRGLGLGAILTAFLWLVAAWVVWEPVFVILFALQVVAGVHLHRRSLSAPPAVVAEPRRCETCVSFDLEEGQRVMASFAHFPSAFLSPDQVGVTYAEQKERELMATMADGAPDVSQHELTRKKLGGRVHSWKQYGACGQYNIIVNQFDYTDPQHKDGRECPLYRAREKAKS